MHASTDCQKHLHFSALIKDGPPREHYLFLWRSDQIETLMSRIGVMAASTELSLTWADAARLAMKIRRCVE